MTWESLLPLAYGSSLAGKRYATAWTLNRGRTTDGLHEIESLLELDPTVIEMGGSIVRQRSHLFCDDALQPVRYKNDAEGQRLELRFNADEIEAILPDGSRQTIPRDGAQYLVDANLPGLTALIYSMLDPQCESTIRVFSIEQLITIPYTTTPVGDGWHRSSHRSEVRLDDHGVMIEARAPARGVRVWIERPIPPVPQWPESLARQAVINHYEPPPNRTFQLEDVVIDGPVTPIGATLTIPAGNGPFPTVLFLSGSGTHDRHGIAGEIDTGTHEIVDALAESGFAGLRFDTRGAGTTSMGADTLDRGLDSEIADARACLAWLRTREDVVGKPLVLIGHSQGATIALVLANESPVDGVVLLAPMGRSLDEIIADQIVAHGKVVGLTAEQVAQQIADVNEAVDLIASGKTWTEGEIPDYLLGMLRTPTWLQQFLAYRTTELIATLRCPVLLCQGEKDFQVSAERDARPLADAAIAAGVQCELVVLPQLDHLFKRSAGESTLAEYYERRPVDPVLIETIERWLRDLTAV